MEHPIVFVINKYLDKLGINNNREELKLQLLSHPSFPTIVSVSDLFNHFNLDHYALKVSNTIDSLIDLPTYFLAHCDETEDPKLLLAEKKNNQVKLYWKKEYIKTVSIDEFLSIWSGVIIVLSETASVKTKKHIPKSYILEFTISLFIISALFGVLSINSNLLQVLLITSSVVGIAVSILITQHELGKNLKSLNKFCKRFENTSCDDVINSKGALLFGFLKLSDLAIIYFSSQFLYVLIATIASLNIHFIFTTLSLLSLPMIAYSIIYQGFIVKKWCPLCLALVAILISQAIIVFSFLGLPSLNTFNSTTVHSLLLYALLFSSLAATWLFFSPLLSKEQALYSLEIKYLKFKRNYDFFTKALSLSTKTSKYYGSKGEITFGNPSAKLILTLITNPTCYYCIEAHNVIEKIISLYAGEVCVKIRFNLMNLHMDKTNARTAHFFLEVFNTHGEDKCRTLMHEFYNSKNKEQWIANKEVVTNPEYVQILEMHKSWCKENGINFTPSLIIGDQLYPKKYYLIEDLPYFLEELMSDKKNPNEVVIT